MDMNQRPDTQEAAMARADLYKMANYSFKLFKMIHDGDQLEGWVQAKITKAADYVASVYHYMEYEMKFSEYGNAIENSDMYAESVKKEFKAKLMEAKKKLEKLKDIDEGWDDMMKASKEREKQKGTGKFDKKSTSTGTVYTRKSSTFDDGGKDADQKKAEKKSKKANEGLGDVAKKVGGALKKAGSKALDKLGHGSDEDMIKDLQKKVGMPQTGKKPMAVKNEALKGGQKKLDVDKDGKLEKSDFAKLRASKKVKEATVTELKKSTLASYAKKASKDAVDLTQQADGHHEYGDPRDGEKLDKKAEKRVKGVGKAVDRMTKESAKPDFLDMDKDGNKKEPMKKAVADKKKNPFAKK